MKLGIFLTTMGGMLIGAGLFSGFLMVNILHNTTFTISEAFSTFKTIWGTGVILLIVAVIPILFGIRRLENELLIKKQGKK